MHSFIQYWLQDEIVNELLKLGSVSPIIKDPASRVSSKSGNVLTC